MKKLITLSVLSLVLASCSLSRIKSGGSRSGTSMDALRDSEMINISGVSDKKLKIKVLVKNGKSCTGTFDFKEAGKGWFGVVPAKNIYTGKFSSDSKECKEALGQNSNKDFELQHIRFGGILGSSLMSTEGVVICDDAEGLCMGQNTFKISEQ